MQLLRWPTLSADENSDLCEMVLPQKLKQYAKLHTLHDTACFSVLFQSLQEVSMASIRKQKVF